MREACIHSFGGLRCVIKKHWATHLHYDFRLECNGVLLSWALPVGPSCRVGEARTAFEMEDHRLENLLFEGEHATGPIMVWDRGSWAPLIESGDVLSSLEKGYLQFTLQGERVQGLFALTRKASAKGTRRAVWTLCKEAELFPGDCVHSDVLEQWSTSVLTGRTKEQIVHYWNRGKPELPSLFDVDEVHAALPPSNVSSAVVAVL